MDTRLRRRRFVRLFAAIGVPPVALGPGNAGAVVRRQAEGAVPATCRGEARRSGAVPDPAPTIVLRDIAYEPCGVVIPAGVPVEISLVNRGLAVGNLVVDGLGVRSEEVPSGGVAVVAVTAPEGEYAFFGDLPGQRAAGRVGVLRAVASAPAAATPAAASADAGIPPLLRAWAEAWANGDGDRLAATLATPVRFEEVPTGFTVFGNPSGLVEAIDASRADFSEIEIRLLDGFAAGNWAAASGVFSARYAGKLRGVTPGQGQPVGFRFAALFGLTGGLIGSIGVYYDLVPVLDALGVGGSATRVPSGLLVGPGPTRPHAPPTP